MGHIATANASSRHSHLTLMAAGTAYCPGPGSSERSPPRNEYRGDRSLPKCFPGGARGLLEALVSPGLLPVTRIGDCAMYACGRTVSLPVGWKNLGVVPKLNVGIVAFLESVCVGVGRTRVVEAAAWVCTGVCVV